ncbi:hypothetical protein SISNIDRAFT_461225 [Sistotremastrum niveocremeum HHB9708]|uniref:Uncharacterized protein n=2 Tax=Sistotremastraceae TaxID=3402574 RepID=A0A164MX16_9AGAM|nr:hypothetical protein SISNIDRAFT_461225 [Sistotremastrum niveocremeum HHB9708]KZT32805.1 hypothetical protein SISSUDRAFT_1055061 [Sistotremastrum suecicum HHB10207 ss-3]
MDSDSSSSSSISSTSSRSYSRRTHAATYPPLVRWTQHPLWTWRLIHYLNIDRNTYKIVTFGKMFKKLSLGGPQDQRDCFTPMANDIFGIHPIHGPLFRENPNRYIEIIRRRFTT